MQRTILLSDVFNQAITLTKAQNKDGLIRLLKSGVFFLDLYENGYSLIKFLAEQGDKESLKFLNDHFGEHFDDEEEGYALGGHDDEVDAIIKKTGRYGPAIRGYAQAGNLEKVKALCPNDEDKNFALEGFALAGDTDNVNKLLNNSNWYHAVKFYAAANNKAALDAFKEKEAEKKIHIPGYQILCVEVAGYALTGNRKKISELCSYRDVFGERDRFLVRSLVSGGHIALLNEAIEKMGVTIGTTTATTIASNYLSKAHADVPLFLAHINNDHLRSLFFNSFEILHTKSLPLTIRPQSTRINWIMNKYHIDHYQAERFIPLLFTWFSLVPHLLVQRGLLNQDIFWNFACFLTGISLNDTKAIFNGYYASIYNIQKKNTGFFSSFKSEETLLQEKVIIACQYENRASLQLTECRHTLWSSQAKQLGYDDERLVKQQSLYMKHILFLLDKISSIKKECEQGMNHPLRKEMNQLYEKLNAIKNNIDDSAGYRLSLMLVTMIRARDSVKKIDNADSVRNDLNFHINNTMDKCNITIQNLRNIKKEVDHPKIHNPRC